MNSMAPELAGVGESPWERDVKAWQESSVSTFFQDMATSIRLLPSARIDEGKYAPRHGILLIA